MEAKDLIQTKKYFQLYRGIVINNKDPKKGGRVQVKIFELHGMPENCTPGNYQVVSGEKDTKYNQIKENDLPWAEVMQNIDFIGFYPAPSDGKDEFANTIDGKGGKSAYKTITRSGKHSGMGNNVILTIGTWVFCLLENGNPNYPIVIGAVAADNEMHKNTNEKNVRIYDSITGHYEEWGDDSGNIIFHHRSGTTITMTKDGDMHFNTTNIKKEYIQAASFLHRDSTYNEFTKDDVSQIMNNNHNLKIINNQNEEVGSNRTRKVGGNENISIGSNQKVNAGGNINITTGGILFLN